MNIKLIGQDQSQYAENRSPIEQVVFNRGIAEPESFFNLDWDCVQSPYDLDNIQLAADKILYHMRTAKTIALLVDCDMDGFSSGALLINYLEMQRLYGEQGENQTWQGNTPTIKYMFHEGKTHGLSDTTIMKELRDLVKPALLIVPDASGTKEQYKALTDLGIDIVVLDHHDMIERGDNDKVIVVNNQQSEKYKNKFLSGVGVVWQLCRVFDDMFLLACSEKYLDLVALGLVADVMDLRSDETRFLVLEGLKPEHIQNSFLQQCLFSKEKLNGYFTPTKIGFNIGPMFNAVARISPVKESELLFKALLDENQGVLVESGKRGEAGIMVPLTAEALRIAGNAQGRQNTRKKKVAGMIDTIIEEEGLLENKIILVALLKGDFEDSHRGLSGLIANELMGYYNRPVLLFFETDYGTFVGSSRSPNSIEAFHDFRSQCQESGLFTFAEGHGQAHGIGANGNNLEEITEYFNEKYSDIDITSTFNVDFYLDANDEKLSETIEEISQYEQYWGTGIQEPLVAVRNVKISPLTTQLVGLQKKTPTLKIFLPNNVEMIKFKSSQEEYDSLMLPYEGIEQYYSGTVVGRMSMNEFAGNSTPQIVIEDYDPGSVEYNF